MKKLFCDVCGKEIIPIKIMVVKECDYTVGYTVYRNDKYGKHPIDLCDKCSSNLLEIIIDHGRRRNERKTESKEI